MLKNKKMIPLRLLALALVIAMTLPLTVGAETIQPRASYYLDSYSAYVSASGGGKIKVYFSVSGTGYIDSIGAKRIAIYESTDNNTWNWVKTFTSTGTPSMMSYNDYHHSGYVSYQGVADRYYKAYVTVWGGDNGAGDNRYFWTSAKKAT